MNPRNCSFAVFAAVLVLATTGHAVGPQAGSHRAASRGPSGFTLLADAEFEPQEDPADNDTAAPGASDWLATPPDPSRHNLWVPAAEWAVCLSLTIPLFMIDPAFVNTGTVSASHFADAWTGPPVWDTDGHVANYLLHPIMGAEAYLTVRNRDYGPIASFLFATGVSVAWEYLFEAWVEQPSGQDLLVTSPIGSLQGELRFQLRRRVARWDSSLGRNALLILLDPIEAIHRSVARLFASDSNDAKNETVGSSLNVGPDQARVMIHVPF